MDVVFNSMNSAISSGGYFIMDNDSGYVSNNLDQESNSDSVTETLNNSSVEILKSFLPKSVYISEDALLERPDIDQATNVLAEEENTRDFPCLPFDDSNNIEVSVINNTNNCATLNRFNSFQSDSGSSACSVVVPIAEPIYFNLSSKVNSDLPFLAEDNISSNPSDGPFFGYENVPMEGANRVFRNGLDILNKEVSTENKIHSILSRLIAEKQKSVYSETNKTTDEESKITKADNATASIMKEPSKLVEHSVENSVVHTNAAESFTEKSNDAVANNSFINIEELPIFIGDEPILEISTKKDDDSMNHRTELTPQKLEKTEDDATVEKDLPINSSAINSCDKKNLVTLQDQDNKVLSAEPNVVVTETENTVLTNLTNTSIFSSNEASTSKTCTLPRRNSVKDKENFTEPEVFKTPNKCRKRKFSEIGSPDLFPDEESSRPEPSVVNKVIEERFIHKLDHKLIKRVQKTISGLPPPPELTRTNSTVDEMLAKLEANKNLFWTEENLKDLKIESADKEKESMNGSHNSSFGCTRSILIEGQYEQAVKKEFPEILYSRYHGLHHNRSKLSEEIEHLCDKYGKRYVGAETQSSCCAVETQHSSPGRRKLIKPKWAVKSPGRRLSHLAKRRITFSSASLQAGSSSGPVSRKRQILIDYKKLELLNTRKSPKKSPRRTPLKSPMLSPSNGRTPSSSAKKKLRMRFRLLSGNFKEATAGPSSSVSNSKRALFQSPDKDSQFRNILSTSSSSINSTFERDLANCGAKRSLFSSPNKIKTSLFSSPTKRSPFRNQQIFEKKRKRDDDDENLSKHPKLSRSQSSHGVSGKEPRPESSFPRAKSEILSSLNMTELSAANKKKLQWAVYESLKLQNISTTHPQFKVFASVLARVTRRCVFSSNIRLENSGTSEKMLRIARCHSYAVVKGKSVEEIMSDYNKSKSRTQKPQGYIAPQDYREPMVPSRDSALKERDSNSSVTKSYSSQPIVAKPESRIDRIRKVINFEDNR